MGCSLGLGTVGNRDNDLGLDLWLGNRETSLRCAVPRFLVFLCQRQPGAERKIEIAESEMFRFDAFIHGKAVHVAGKQSMKINRGPVIFPLHFADVFSLKNGYAGSKHEKSFPVRRNLSSFQVGELANRLSKSKRAIASIKFKGKWCLVGDDYPSLNSWKFSGPEFDAFSLGSNCDLYVAGKFLRCEMPSQDKW